MDRYRIQDLVGKLSGVSLQNTVSVLNALYVVSKELEREGYVDFARFRGALESSLVMSAIDDNGKVQGLRVKPNAREAVACYRMSRKVKKFFFEDVMRIKRDSQVELIVQMASETQENYFVGKVA